MKRIKSVGCLRIGIIFFAAVLLSACTASKYSPAPVPESPNGEYLASKVAKFEMSAPAEAGWMVSAACAGPACDLLAQLEAKPAPATAQCSFPADKPATETAPDRQARAAPAAGDSDNMESVKPEKKEPAPVGAYQKSSYRTVRKYERKGK
jgi:hypothetical protein